METLWNEVTLLYNLHDEGFLDADLAIKVSPIVVQERDEFEGVDGGELKRVRTVARAFLKATEGRR